MRKIILLITLTISLFGCSKKEEVKILNTKTVVDSKLKTNEIDKQKLATFLNQFEIKSQFFTVSSTNSSKITGKKGTIIRINPSDLEFENGDKIIGQLKIELKELTNQKELFKNNTQTVSNGKLLISGGSYYIDITSDGKKIKLKKGKNININFPKITSKKMELFYGERNELKQMNWTPTNFVFSSEIPKTKNNAEFVLDTLTSDESNFNDLLSYLENGEDNVPKKDIKRIDKIDKKIYNSMNIQKLGWINCDSFYNEVTEKLTIIYNSENKLDFVNAFIVYENINSVMNLFSEKRTKLTSEINIPINQKIKIIGFSFKNDKFYFGIKELTTTKGIPIEINFREVTEKELNEVIKSI